MGTNISLQPAFFNTDADFRAWGKNISDQLAAMGLVKTADTGQINWATVVKPAATNTSQGYEIWRFDDALQSTKPVHIKLEYGSAAAVDRPAMWLTVGTGGTNGAGTLQGSSVGTRKQVPAVLSKAAGNTLNTYVSATSSRISLCTNLDPTSTSFALLIMVERTRDANGAETGDAVMTFCAAGSGVGQFQTVLFGGAAPLSAGSVAPALLLTSTTASLLSSVGSDLAFSPWFIALGKFFYPLALTYTRADLADLVTLSFTYLGASHTFLPMGAGVAFGNLVQLNNTNVGLLMPWE